MGSGDDQLISRAGMALMRSISSASLTTTTTPSYPDASARFNLCNTKIMIDYASPPLLPDLDSTTTPLACSPQNIVFFGRGNRVQYKNLTVSEEVGQLCKIQDGGHLQIVECAGTDLPDTLALATTKGLVQLWDIKAKKATASWSLKGVTAMRWNGPVLTIGGIKGTIRQYDTRISPTSKMKEQARKVTRHQSRITSLDWNMDGRILASGDGTGTIYCWDSRDKVPLDVGDTSAGQRRKRMQHAGAITVSSLSIPAPDRNSLLTRTCRRYHGAPGSRRYSRLVTIQALYRCGPRAPPTRSRTHPRNSTSAPQ